MMESLLGGDLNPFSGSVFRYFPEVSLGNCHQGRKLWKGAEAKLLQIAANLTTGFFLCFYHLYSFSPGRNPDEARGVDLKEETVWTHFLFREYIWPLGLGIHGHDAFSWLLLTFFSGVRGREQMRDSGSRLGIGRSPRPV